MTAKKPLNQANGNSQPNEPIRVDPLFNEAFIRIFGSERSKGIARSLINAILDAAGIDPIDEISTIDAEHTAVDGSIRCKSARFDVQITAKGSIVDLEAQRHPEDIERRSVFYASRIISNALQIGDSYKELPRVIIITLLDTRSYFPDNEAFIAVQQPQWVEGGQSYEGEGSVTFILVELEKIRKRYTTLTKEVLADELLSWLYLLTAGFKSGVEVEKLANTLPSIEEFAQLYGFAMDDPKLNRAYEDYHSSILEYNSLQDFLARVEREAREKGMQEGREEGRSIGIEQGIEQGRRAIIQRLQDLGIDESIISCL